MRKILMIAFALCLSGFHSKAQNYMGDQKDIDQILANITAFSKAVVSGDATALGLAYTEDGKLFPNNLDIVSGRDSVTSYWTFSEDSKIIYHKVTPSEIKILGDEAYDFGYYEGTTVESNGDENSWRGKYVIVWRKVEGEWKIYLDIWNRIAD